VTEERDTRSFFTGSDYEYDSAHEATPSTSGAARAEGEEPPHGLLSGTKGDDDDGDYGYDSARDMWPR
jgi:hypothetical protein